MEKIVLYDKKEKSKVYLSVLPAALLIFLVGVVPGFYTFILSLHKYELINPPAVFTGGENYINLLTDERFTHAVAFTLGFAFIATLLELIIGLLAAVLLADREVKPRLSAILRTLIMVPFVIEPVVASYTFKTLIYDQTFGYLNYYLKEFGLPAFDLFKGAVNAPLGLLIMEVLLRTPFIIIILYAGVSSIDSSIYDAAAIDGVSWKQKIIHIILPSIAPVILVGGVLRFMDALKMFDEVYVLTAGGPGYETENISLFTINQGFDYFHMGYAAASAFLFLIIIIILVSFYIKKARL